MRGFAVAICAPSGTGKTTVARALVERRQDLHFSVSATTRRPRQGERPGVDYQFVNREEFEAMVAAGQLLEWAEVHGELYGTPSANQAEAERLGKLLLLDIDVQGARQLARARPDMVTIFLLPPSFTSLMERLQERGSESASELRRRLVTARSELESVGEFQYLVINDRLEDTLERIAAILAAEGQRTSRQDELVSELVQGIEAALRENASGASRSP